MARRARVGNPWAAARGLALRLVWAAFALAGLTVESRAQTEIVWWHAMSGGNGDVVQRIVNDFNALQQAYRVVPVFKGSYADTLKVGLAAAAVGAPPHILQVYEVGTTTMMKAAADIVPLGRLMREAGQPLDPTAYIQAVASHYTTVGGELLSLPFNASSMVMWINQDALRKAGLDPARPPATWPELFEAARKLRQAGYATCGFSSTWATWAHIEQLSTWHGLPIATQENGLRGYDAVLTFNGPLQVRHLETLVELQRDNTFDYSGRTNSGDRRFIRGECPILLSSSSIYANLQGQANFAWSAAPMPYYPDVPGAPQNSLIGGGSLWALGGKTADEYKGVARFFAYLSDIERQMIMLHETGYVPVTYAAYEQLKASGFYRSSPYLEVAMLSLLNKPPTPSTRGLRLGEMSRLRDIWSEEIEMALTRQKSARAALDDSVARGDAVLREFERAVAR